MTRFIQLHLLTSYPPSNLNRDDLGQPKTARIGGTTRLRISSQSLKRAWRTSELFQQQLAGHIGTRTKLLGEGAYKKLLKAGVAEKNARSWAEKITQVYGAVKKETPLKIEQVVHVSPEETASLDTLIATLASEARAPEPEELDALVHSQHAVDIAMFGRMLAAKPQHNSEAAVQVAHAIGVHASAIEDDAFTTVDDLNVNDSAAAHMGEAGFGAAVFYLYLCIDKDLLVRNLGDAALATRALRALTESAIKIGPSGKQASYASRAYAHYAMVEKGAQQPRSLSLAFVKAIMGEDYPGAAVQALHRVRDNMDQVFGTCADARYEFDALQANGTLDALLDFVAADAE
jgi:CRISPR system Cascade subunit CasC